MALGFSNNVGGGCAAPARNAVLTLKLSDFRSYARAQLRFDGRVVVFWGPNGAGKTNALEALSLLAPGRGLRGASAEEMARAGSAQGWSLSADVRRGALCHEVVLTHRPKEPRALRLDGKAATQTALGSVVAMAWLTPAMDRLWLDAPEARRRFLDRLTFGFFPDHAEAAQRYEHALRERNRLLREGVSNPAWLSGLEAQMADAGARLMRHRAGTLAALAAGGEAEEAAFPTPELSLVGVEPFGPEPTREALRKAFAASRAADLAAGRTLVGPHRVDLKAVWAARQMPAALCSTGEQKALLISVLLAYARAMVNTAGVAPILLFDEIAAHLDPARREALFDALCRLGVQAFLTGTEAALFAPLGSKAQWFAVTEGPEGSLVVEASPG